MIHDCYKAKAMAVEEVAATKRRCKRVIERIERLPPSTNITISSKQTLLRLALSELRFLARFSSLIPEPFSLSTNIGHLEAVVHILHQPFISGVSRVCKNVRNGHQHVHVDIVCTLSKNPVWIIVSHRNPNFISWHGDHKTKGFKSKLEQVLATANACETLKPYSIILFFANGLGNHVRNHLRDEFGASEFTLFDYVCEEIEDDWINVLPISFPEACVLEIKLNFSVLGSDKKLLVNPIESNRQDENVNVNPTDAFCSLLSQMKFCSLGNKLDDLASEDALINFDTTALVALVTGISNGCADKLLDTPETELRHRFKGNTPFVIAQVMSEIQNPFLEELNHVIAGKQGIVCQTVLSEFKELVQMCGGPNEKLRADRLLKCLTILHDSPSKRMLSLPTTRNLAMKNKIVFGTGDRWHAPTLTANMAFVRAVSQTGMPLCTIEHRPRALTGD